MKLKTQTVEIRFKIKLNMWDAIKLRLIGKAIPEITKAISKLKKDLEKIK